jgi:hypothetical protein
MAHYLLSVYTPADGTPPTPEELDAIMKEVAAYNQELRDAAAWVFSGGLEAPATATVLRLQDGDVLTTDGPFAEAKEQLAGYYVVDCESIERAAEIAAKDPASRLWAIEVRAVMDEAGMEM